MSVETSDDNQLIELIQFPEKFEKVKVKLTDFDYYEQPAIRSAFFSEKKTSDWHSGRHQSLNL